MAHILNKVVECLLPVMRGSAYAVKIQMDHRNLMRLSVVRSCAENGVPLKKIDST